MPLRPKSHQTKQQQMKKGQVSEPHKQCTSPNSTTLQTRDNDGSQKAEHSVEGERGQVACRDGTARPWRARQSYQGGRGGEWGRGKAGGILREPMVGTPASNLAEGAS
jgi:hypothetical protein